jgi:pterin-4a-carbinolamine dehydratase
MSVSTENSKSSSQRGCHEWPLLEDSDIQKKIENFTLWKLKEEKDGDKTTYKMSRKFMTKGFPSALEFIAAAGIVAETFGHHPDIHLTSYRNVEIVIFTHSLGGLTDNDFALAKAIDENVMVLYSPKWLREHPHAVLTSANLTK